MSFFGLSGDPWKLPFVGGLFENEDAKQQRKQFHSMANAYAAYRPEQQQARQNALAQQMSLFQPVASSMAAMYGPGAVPNLGPALQNPMSPNMMALGNPAGFPRPAPTGFPSPSGGVLGMPGGGGGQAPPWMGGMSSRGGRLGPDVYSAPPPMGARDNSRGGR